MRQQIESLSKTVEEREKKEQQQQEKESQMGIQDIGMGGLNPLSNNPMITNTQT